MIVMEIVPVLCIWTLITTAALSEASFPKPAVIYTSQHSALITWPDTDASSDEYIVEYGIDWQHSQTLYVSRKTNTAMIHSLTPDTLYAVRVKNAPKSHPGPSIKFRTRPNAVSFFAPSVAVQSRGTNKLLVTWRLPPGMRRSDVVHFNLVFCPLYSPYFRQTTLVLPGHYRSFLLEYLRPETVYQVKIAALLKKRKGPYSEWIVEKTGGGISSTAGHGGSKTTQSSPLLHSTREAVQHITQATATFSPQNQLTDLTLPTTTQTLPTTTQTLPTTTNRNKNEPITLQPITTSTTDENTPTPVPTAQTIPSTPQRNTDYDRETSLPTTQHPFTQTIPSTPQQHTDYDRETSLPTTRQANPTSVKPFTNREPTEADETSSLKGLAPTREVITEIQEISKQRASTPSQPPLLTRKITSAATTLIISGPLPTVSDGSACDVIEPSMCSDNGYHTTKVQSNNQTQMNKRVENTLTRLSICKSQEMLKQFICAVNFPYCSIKHGGPFLPCRSMCTLAKSICGLENYADWPAELNCENFPKVGESKICIAFGDNAATPTPTKRPITLVTESLTPHQSTFSSMTTNPEQTTTSPGNVEPDSTSTSMVSNTDDVVTQAPPTTRATSPPITTRPTTTATQAGTTSNGNGDGQTTTGPGNVEAVLTSTSMVSNKYGVVTQAPPTTRATSPPITTRPTTTATQASINSNRNGDDSSVGHIKISISTVAPPPSTPSAPTEGCEPLRLRICNGAGYSMVQFPNYFNQTHQNDAARALFHYWPLVEAQCSSKFTLFLCSLYTPVCTKTLPRGRMTVRGNILPCRSICKQVRQECATLMRIYEYTWPDGVDCQKFPEDGKENCLYGNADVTDSRAFVKFAEPEQQNISPNEKSGVNGCQEFPVGHICKNHYMVGALSNTSKSFKSVNTAIRNRMALVKDSASKKCVRNLELFMCSMYVPKCSKEYRPQKPCRSQCKTTLRRCNGVLQQLDIFIPELNKCKQFPITLCTENKRKHGKKRKLEIESL